MRWQELDGCRVVLSTVCSCRFGLQIGFCHSAYLFYGDAFIGSPHSLFRMHWDHELASIGGTTRQRLGLRQSSAAFPGTRRMGKRQGTGAVQNLAALLLLMEIGTGVRACESCNRHTGVSPGGTPAGRPCHYR